MNGGFRGHIREGGQGEKEVSEKRGQMCETCG